MRVRAAMKRRGKLVMTAHKARDDYLKWLRYAHNGAHVVAIVTQDEVARAFGQLFLRKGYLEHDSLESVKWQQGKKRRYLERVQRLTSRLPGAPVEGNQPPLAWPTRIPRSPCDA